MKTSDEQVAWEMRQREELRATEAAFNNALIAQAREKGRNITKMAPDGCEVTATPDGTVFYNTADWW